MASVKAEQDSKQKNMDETVLDHILKSGKKGISDDDLAKALPNLQPIERTQCINRLVSAKKIQLYHNDKNAVIYKEVSAEEAAKTKGLGPEEVMIYQTIKAAGNTGLWTKDMRLRTNLAQPHITKILKTLEGRGMVKSVKNVNNPSRKVYMLAELEPSRDLTGGAWYTENQFDMTFIKVLRRACLTFIQREGDTTLRELTRWCAKHKFSKVELREEDVQNIVNTLMYDNLIDNIEGQDDNDDQEHFKPMQGAVQAFLQRADEEDIDEEAPTTALGGVPCGSCPVFDQCRDDGIISPATCEYYNKWLSLV